MTRYPRLPKGIIRLTVGLLLIGWGGNCTNITATADEVPVIGQVPMPTMGGKQFWGDELWFQQWRIQRNTITGHCRLLDKSDQRLAWGSFPQCREKLEQIKRDKKLPAMQGEVVLALHGLGRSSASLKTMCNHLRQQGQYTVMAVAYPSTRRNIDAHARSLGRIIDGFEGVTRVSFVAHSMGNIVIRRYLAQRKEDVAIEPNKRRPEMGRFVMLAPPNHGSTVATALKGNRLFETIGGEGAKQLGAGWEKLEKKLATPDFQFGIIAGGKKDGGGINPMLPGGNDGTISRETTRLVGAHDFVGVGSMHSFIMNDAKTLEYTLRFLKNGYFISPQARQPIHADTKPKNPVKQN
jgi:hypothetical protein